MPRIKPIDRENADVEINEILEAVQKKLGILPNLISTLAVSPAALQSYLALSEQLSAGQLSAQQREKIALNVAQNNACMYCLSAHTAIAKGARVSDEEIAQARRSKSSDSYDEALLYFSEVLVEKRGQVNDEDLAVLKSAGVEDAIILELVANVSLNIFTNYLNLVAQTTIDFPSVEL